MQPNPPVYRSPHCLRKSSPFGHLMQVGGVVSTGELHSQCDAIAREWTLSALLAGPHRETTFDLSFAELAGPPTSADDLLIRGRPPFHWEPALSYSQLLDGRVHQACKLRGRLQWKPPERGASLRKKKKPVPKEVVAKLALVSPRLQQSSCHFQIF